MTSKMDQQTLNLCELFVWNRLSIYGSASRDAKFSWIYNSRSESARVSLFWILHFGSQTLVRANEGFALHTDFVFTLQNYYSKPTIPILLFAGLCIVNSQINLGCQKDSLLKVVASII